jgi:fumarate reductase subunit D
MRPDEQAGSISQVPGGAETVREQDKVQLILAYLGILALVPLLTVKDSEFVKWHAKNGLVLGVGGGIAISVVFGILGQIVGILGCLAPLAYLGLLIVDIMAMLKALKGERWRIPLVSDLADKF